MLFANCDFVYYEEEFGGFRGVIEAEIEILVRIRVVDRSRHFGKLRIVHGIT